MFAFKTVHHPNLLNRANYYSDIEKQQMQQIGELKQVLAQKNVVADIDLLSRAVIMPNYDLSITKWRYP